PRCEPPWSERELRHKCHDADTLPFDKPRGWLLREPEYYPLSVLRGRTDVNNAARFVALHPDRVRWVGTWDKWLAWDGARWEADNGRAVDSLAKEVSRGLWAELTEELERDDKEGKKLIPWVRYTNSKNGIAAMLTLARCEVAIGHGCLDADPWLLN